MGIFGRIFGRGGSKQRGTPPPLPNRRGGQPPPLPKTSGKGGPPPLPQTSGGAKPPFLPFGRGGPPPLPQFGDPSYEKAPPLLPGEDPLAFVGDVGRRSSRDVEFLKGGDLLSGKWIAFNSQAVLKAKYQPNIELDTGDRTGDGTVEIVFINGSTYEYYGIPAGAYLDFVTSSSKGRYAYYEIRGPGPSPTRKGKSLPPWDNFKIINGPTRSSAHIAALKKARAPKTKQQQLRYYNVRGKKNAGGGYESKRR